jgi:hypothetical protein
MLRVVKGIAAVAAITVALIVTFVSPAAANTVVKSVYQVNESYTESGICDFDLRVHLSGSFKTVQYFDNTGFLYKEIDTPGGGGPFVVSYTAHGTTLRHNENYSTVQMFNPDGTWTYKQRGPYNVFTAPGFGIVLHDTGTATWTEPDEELLFISGGPHQAINGDFDEFCAAFS